MKHPHAELMMQYAQDAMETYKPWERWQLLCGDEWLDMSLNPEWNISNKYRRKPLTININGFDVPEPVREELKKGEVYYCPDPINTDYCDCFTWSGDYTDIKVFKRGLIHLTQEAAALHGKALASFTERKK